MARRMPDTISAAKPAYIEYWNGAPREKRRTEKTNNNPASVGMMTFPNQFVRFVNPSRKVILGRSVSHHLLDQNPQSAHSQKPCGAKHQPQIARPVKSKLKDRAADRQTRRDRHDAARQIVPHRF